jgi:hypothetical protein
MQLFSVHPSMDICMKACTYIISLYTQNYFTDVVIFLRLKRQWESVKEIKVFKGIGNT